MKSSAYMDEKQLRQWSEFKRSVDTNLPATVEAHHGFILARAQEPVLPDLSDGTEMINSTVRFALGERDVTITVLLEAFPGRGFAISIFSLFRVVRSFRVFNGDAIRPAVADTMNEVGVLIAAIKGGIPERRISFGT